MLMTCYLQATIQASSATSRSLLQKNPPSKTWVLQATSWVLRLFPLRLGYSSLSTITLGTSCSVQTWETPSQSQPLWQRHFRPLLFQIPLFVIAVFLAAYLAPYIIYPLPAQTLHSLSTSLLNTCSLPPLPICKL